MTNPAQRLSIFISPPDSWIIALNVSKWSTTNTNGHMTETKRAPMYSYRGGVSGQAPGHSLLSVRESLARCVGVSSRVGLLVLISLTVWPAGGLRVMYGLALSV